MKKADEISVAGYHSAVKKIRKILEDNKVWHECFEHEPVRTSEQAAKIRTGYSLEQGTKALIIKCYKPGNNFFTMLIVRGSDKFDEKKIKSLLDIKEFRFATEQEVGEITSGVLPGGGHNAMPASQTQYCAWRRAAVRQFVYGERSRTIWFESFC